MKYYLYTFEDNWADEMDVQGFAVLTEDEKDMAIAQIKRQYKNGGTICFGTNEDNEYDDLDDVMDCVEFEEISQSEYSTLKKLFGESFGELGPLDIYSLGEDSEDFDDEEDEDDDYERDFEGEADKIVNFIKSEYGIETKEMSGYMDEWLGGKEFDFSLVKDSIRIMQAVKLDCEKRSAEKIKKLELPIDLSQYIKKANSYLYLYTSILETRKWPDTATYEVAEIVNQMPDYFLDSVEDYYNMPESISELFKKL